MQGREEPASFRVQGVKGEEFFEDSRGPAILAGIHLRDCFFEERAFLAVADGTLFVGTGGCFLIGSGRGFSFGSHDTTLADTQRFAA